MRDCLLAAMLAVWAGGLWAAETTGVAKCDLAPDEVPTHMVKVLRTTNKAQINRYVPKVYELKNVNPFDVMRFFRRVMEIEEGRWATFVAPDGKSGLVVLIAPIYQLPYLDRLMATIDRPGLTSSAGAEKRHIRLSHRAADDAGLLQVIYGQATHSSSKSPHGTRAGDLTMYCDLETGAVFVYAPPSVVEKVEAVVKELDKPAPQVLIEATVYEIDLNNDGAIGFDYYAWKNGPGRNAFAFGAFAEYEKVGRLKGGANVFDSGFYTYGMPHHRFRNHGYNVAYFFDVSTAYFDFLVSKGAARVVTSGRLLSKIPTNYLDGLNAFGQARYKPDMQGADLAGTPAEFRACDEVLYYRVETGPSARAGARPVGFMFEPYAGQGPGVQQTQLIAPVPRPAGLMLDPYGMNIDFPDNRTLVGRLRPRTAGGTEICGEEIAAVDVGTRLRVTPRIAADNILLDLQLEVSSLLGFDSAGEPRISARRVAANTRVRDGEEVVFGGLTRTRRVQSVRKFPILGSIPVLGWAFGAENSGVRKTVVVTVVRATRIGRPPSDVAALIEQVEGSQETPIPKGRFGFDQWLLDER